MAKGADQEIGCSGLATTGSCRPWRRTRHGLGLALAVSGIDRTSETRGQPSTAPSTTTERAAPNPPPSYSVRVDYEDERVADAAFDDTLAWNADLYLVDRQLLSAATRSRVALYEKASGGWQRVRARATSTAGGRCEEGQVNVLIGSTAQAPMEEAIGGGWSRCTDHRVVIPETRSSRRTYVDLCVRTRADSA